MAPELALGGLQRWLQVVIESPGPVKRALRSREAARLVRPRDTGKLVLPSARGLRPAERVGIYQGMYLPRMLEALESDYPGLAHFLGPKSWTRLVRSYLNAHPSRSYTLNELGRALPKFVRHARVPRAAFCHDLARLERAVSEAFDAEEAKPLTQAALGALRPREIERTRLVPVPALRLLRLDHDAGAYLDSLKDERHQHPPARRARTRLVVYRRSYRVMQRRQSEAAFALLEDLWRGADRASAGTRARPAGRRPARGRRGGVPPVPRVGGDGPVPGRPTDRGLARHRDRGPDDVVHRVALDVVHAGQQQLVDGRAQALGGAGVRDSSRRPGARGERAASDRSRAPRRPPPRARPRAAPSDRCRPAAAPRASARRPAVRASGTPRASCPPRRTRPSRPRRRRSRPGSRRGPAAALPGCGCACAAARRAGRRRRARPVDPLAHLEEPVELVGRRARPARGASRRPCRPSRRARPGCASCAGSARRRATTSRTNVGPTTARPALRDGSDRRAADADLRERPHGRLLKPASRLERERRSPTSGPAGGVSLPP